MLTVTHLSKRFGDIQAVKDISFHVKKGSTFAFLGTNGAGKTTVIRMILHLLTPDQGDVVFTGGVLEEVTGIVFQTHRLDGALTLEENLMLRAKLHGIPKLKAKQRIDHLLDLTKMSEKRKRRYGDCSGGEKRKIDIIRALLHDPAFLILDEPTTGLDAESRKDIWKFLRRQQKEQDLTIFLTTHYIEETEDADDVLIMHEGIVEVQGTPQKLKTRYGKTALKLYPADHDHLINLLTEQNIAFQLENNNIFINLQTTKEAIAILNTVQDHIDHFSIQEASLEQVFLKVTEQLKREAVQ